jgi:hypothetical protein
LNGFPVPWTRPAIAFRIGNGQQETARLGCWFRGRGEIGQDIDWTFLWDAVCDRTQRLLAPGAQTDRPGNDGPLSAAQGARFVDLVHAPLFELAPRRRILVLWRRSGPATPPPTSIDQLRPFGEFASFESITSSVLGIGVKVRYIGSVSVQIENGSDND